MTYYEIKEAFEDYIQTEKFNASRYPMYQAINYILDSQGKRFRPILLIMAYQMYQKDINQALPAALSVELFHNFTLIHDDIMDEASIRRGRSSVHHKYGINQAILAGDAMMMLAYQYLIHASSNDQMPKVMKTITQMAVEVCEGQDLDMVFEKLSTVTVDDYIRMIEQKTSVLLAASLKIGGILGGASESDARCLYGFGRNIGIAFQIQDDILDTFGASSKVGKKIGGDIVQKKKTYLFTKAMEVLSDEGKKRLISLYDSNEDLIDHDVQKVKDIFIECNVLDLASQEQEKYYNTAMKFLEELQIENDLKEPLRQVSRMLFDRTS